MGAFDHLEWTYDGAFEQLFGLGRGGFEQKCSKNSNARGVARGRCLSFDLTGTLQCKIKETVLISELKPSLNENVGSEKLLLY